MQIRPWPFAAEELVEAYWFGSFWQKDNGAWMLEVVFNSLASGEKRIVPLAWGSLPYIRLGRVYQDGYLIEQEPRGRNGHLWDAPLSDGHMLAAANMPKALWSLAANPIMCRQKIWNFRYLDQSVYVPCTELLRAFFATSTFMANQLLTHYSLEKLVQERQIEEDSERRCHYIFNDRIPSSVVRDRLAFQIAWLLENKEVKREWDRTVRLITEAKGTGQKWIIPEFAPFRGLFTLDYRGFLEGNNLLVLEINKIGGLNIGFDKFSYHHPSFKVLDGEGGVTEGNGRFRLKKDEEGQGEKREYAEGDAGMASEGNSHVVQTVLATELSLPKNFKITRVKVPKTEKAKPVETPSATEEGQNDRQKRNLTTQDSQSGGALRPVEIIGAELLDHENWLGLAEFMKEMEKLANENREWYCKIEFYKISQKTKIAKLPSGNERYYAIVKVELKPDKRVYIVEVARPDRWQIATLMLKVDSECELDFGKYIGEMGHWKKIELKLLNSKTIFLRHTEGVWWEKIKEKIMKI